VPCHQGRSQPGSLSPSKRNEYRSPWRFGWWQPGHIGVVLNPSMVQWPLPAPGSGLGLSPSLRQEDGPSSGVRARPHLCQGGLSPVTSQSIVFFFFFPPPVSKTNKKREFLNLWSTQKGEAPAEGALGTVPAGRGAHCSRGSFSRVPASRWDHHGPWGHGSCSLPAAHHSWRLAR